MAIKFYTDRIEIGDFTLSEGNGGLQFNGVARAENFFATGDSFFQGSSFGYESAGSDAFPNGNYNTIEKFPFATDTNSTDVGDLIRPKRSPAGQSSDTHGYVCNGWSTIPASTSLNTIERFPFASDTNATDVADDSKTTNLSWGHSSKTTGYIVGGYPEGGDDIRKFSFASVANAIDVAKLSLYGLRGGVPLNSSTHGYNAGGNGPATGFASVNTIDRYSFAYELNALDVGDLTNPISQAAASSSTTHGYVVIGDSGTFPPTPSPSRSNGIQRFQFASNAGSVKVGDITYRVGLEGGVSSTTHGYASGGQSPSTVNGTPAPILYNYIEKFPFSTESNVTDVGDLLQSRVYKCSPGNQI